MVDLQEEVEKRGFTVCHIKTDSIKIQDATLDIIEFVMDFGKKYGYAFEHEATYDRMCLVNDAVYIAKYSDVDWCERRYGYVPSKQAKGLSKNGGWTATGTQFAVPYVFKKLFSKEQILFEDMCETKSVSTSLYLDLNEKLPDVSEREKDLERVVKKAKEFDITMDLSGNSGDAELDSMIKEIAQGHNYRFVGKVGSFCPIKPGCNGGELLREGKDKDGNIKYSSATGAKGYRWLESEMVKGLGKFDDIDRSYYDKLVDDAVDTISKYGDFEWFVSDDIKEAEKTKNEDTPPWLLPCGDKKYETCYDCPKFTNNAFDIDCGLGYDISNIFINKTNKEKEN